MDFGEQSEKLFDKYQYTYSKKHIEDHYLWKRFGFINKLIKIDDFVLDIGCSTGATIDKINSKNKYGADFSKRQIEDAKKIHKNINFNKMDAKKLLFKDNFFNFVYSANTLYYVESLSKDGLKRSLKEIKRVLKKEGKVLIIEPNKRNPYWKLFLGKEKYDTGMEKHLSVGKIIKELKDLDFKNIKLCYRGLLPTFCPKFLMPFAKGFEYFIEKSIFAKYLCSHFYLVGVK